MSVFYILILINNQIFAMFTFNCDMQNAQGLLSPTLHTLREKAIYSNQLKHTYRFQGLV